MVRLPTIFLFFLARVLPPRTPVPEIISLALHFLKPIDMLRNYLFIIDIHRNSTRAFQMVWGLLSPAVEICALRRRAEPADTNTGKGPDLWRSFSSSSHSYPPQCSRSCASSSWSTKTAGPAVGTAPGWSSAPPPRRPPRKHLPKRQSQGLETSCTNPLTQITLWPKFHWTGRS